MKQSIVVLTATASKGISKTGKPYEMCNIQYVQGEELVAPPDRIRSNGIEKGFIIGTMSIPYTCINVINAVPAIYEVEQEITIGYDGKPAVKFAGIEYVANL